MNPSGFAAVMAGTTILDAPGTRAGTSPQQQEKDAAIAFARRILENHDPADPIAGLARQFLRALGLPA